MTTISEYLGSIPKQRKERFLSLTDLIQQLYPAAKESMRYKMPTYEFKGGWVSVANQKNYISLYTCSAEHLQAFKAKHPAIKTGKGCINFRDRDDIPLDDVAEVIRRAIDFVHP